MTPARKAALQWYHQHPEAALMDHETDGTAPKPSMAVRMVTDGELEITRDPKWHRNAKSDDLWFEPHRLTDLGRRRLHGDDV